MNNIYITNSKNKDVIFLKNKKGLLFKICKNIYINKRDVENIEEIIYSNLTNILASINVKGNIVYSSALQYPKTKENIFYITGKKTYEITLNNFGKIKIYRSNKKELNTAHTIPLTGTSLTISLPKRAIFENYSTRKVDDKKILKEEAKNKLRKMVELCQNNESKLIVLKEEMKSVGIDLDMEKEGLLIQEDIVLFEKEFRESFDGYLYDVERIDKLKELKEIILKSKLEAPIVDYNNKKIVENISFFESYFSNYIEGTRFEIEEAVDIMINKSEYERHNDGHDILSHREITLEKEILFDFSSEELFLNSLKKAHKRLMGHRDEKAGNFKTRNNQAGSRNFVNVELVEGSLRLLYKLVRGLGSIERALVITIGFLEIHPFTDGNGRIGRLLMNSILQSSGYQRIIVPTVMREDYILGLKSFTLNNNYEAYIRLFKKLFKINSEIEYDKSIKELILYFEEKDAFNEKGKWGEVSEEEDSLFNI